HLFCGCVRKNLLNNGRVRILFVQIDPQKCSLAARVRNDGATGLWSYIARVIPTIAASVGAGIALVGICVAITVVVAAIGVAAVTVRSVVAPVGIRAISVTIAGTAIASEPAVATKSTSVPATAATAISALSERLCWFCDGE